ncbi:hypothetical protein ACVWYH_007690 [Bradyrhizobium sp. GM24.11]
MLRTVSMCTMSPCCPTSAAAWRAFYVAEIEELARSSGITTLALVLVYGTRPLWERLGFLGVAPDAALRDKLSCYGASATYMLRELAQ